MTCELGPGRAHCPRHLGRAAEMLHCSRVPEVPNSACSGRAAPPSVFGVERSGVSSDARTTGPPPPTPGPNHAVPSNLSQNLQNFAGLCARGEPRRVLVRRFSKRGQFACRSAINRRVRVGLYSHRPFRPRAPLRAPPDFAHYVLAPTTALKCNFRRGMMGGETHSKTCRSGKFASLRYEPAAHGVCVRPSRRYNG